MNTHTFPPLFFPAPQSRAELDSQLDEARQHMSEAVETATVFRREAEQYRSDLSALQVAMEEVCKRKAPSFL